MNKKLEGMKFARMDGRVLPIKGSFTNKNGEDRVIVGSTHPLRYYQSNPAFSETEHWALNECELSPTVDGFKP